MGITISRRYKNNFCGAKDRRGATSVERINGEGTAETGESGAEETTMTTLAVSNHTFLKKIFFTERTKV
jgi:hypothetical protein